MEIIFIVVAMVAGCGIGYLVMRYVATGQYKKRISEAEKEAEVIKEKKLLEVKEKFLRKRNLTRICSSATKSCCRRKTGLSSAK